MINNDKYINNINKINQNKAICKNSNDNMIEIK